MLTVSAMTLASSTYAWFSMNTQVTATGMQVKARAEGGIVISNAGKAAWSDTGTASTGAATALYPTSTADLTNWYHNKSTNADDANAATNGAGSTGYDVLTSSLAYSDTTYNAGIAYIDSQSSGAEGYGTWDAADSSYYLLNKFYVKSSGDVLTGTKFYINDVKVTSSSSHVALDKCLRVGIKIAGDSNTYIYAPISGGTATYYVAGGSSGTTPITAGTKNRETTITSIGNTDNTSTEVDVYIWYEGEDANCKSTNISGITLDTISVEVQFGTTQIATS